MSSLRDAGRKVIEMETGRFRRRFICWLLMPVISFACETGKPAAGLPSESITLPEIEPGSESVMGPRRVKGCTIWKRETYAGRGSEAVRVGDLRDSACRPCTRRSRRAAPFAPFNIGDALKRERF